MSRRVAINLVAFVLLAVGLTWWVGSTYVPVGPFAPTADRVTLAFASSPGLQEGFEIAYLGHAVGTIEAVRLQGDHVVVDAAVDPAAEVPADVVARVRRKSAVGEPYVDLSPHGDVAADGPRLADGDHVPLARTDVPLSYEEVFTSVADLLEAVPPDATGTLVHELAVALEGREGELRSMVVDGQDVLETAAARADMLDRLATESTRLAGMLADLAPRAGEGLDDLQLLAADVAAARDEIVALLETSPDLAGRVAELVLDVRGPVGCLLASLDRSLAAVDTPENSRRLRHAIDLAPTLIALLHDATHDRTSGPWLRVDPILNLSDDTVRTYPEPLPVPAPEDPGTCDPVAPLELPTAADGSVPPPAAPLAGGAAGSGGAAPAPADTAAPTASPTERDRASSELPSGAGWTPPAWLAWLGGALAVGALRPWRWWRRGRP